MPYHVLSDIVPAEISEAEMIDLTDDVGANAIDQDVYAAHAAKADAIINGNLEAAGYTTPLAPVPTLIKNLSMGFTVFSLYERRRRENMPQSMLDAQRGRERTLREIADGKIRFASTEPQGTGAGVFKTNKTKADREFSSAFLKRF